VYVAPLGLWLTLDAGHFETVTVNLKTRAVRVALAPATIHTETARLRVEQPAHIEGVGAFAPREALKVERGAFDVPLSAQPTWVELRTGAGTR
jgi:hypothetical protein